MTAFNANDRVLIWCTGCDDTLQTDGDQVVTDSNLFDELCINLCGEEDHAEHVPGPDHVHSLQCELIS